MIFQRLGILALNPILFWKLIQYEIKKLLFDIIFLFKNRYPYKIIFIAGLGGSATTKIKNMCGMIPGYFTRFSPVPYKIHINQNITDSAFWFTPKWSYSLFKTHLNPNNKNLKIIKKNGVKKIVVIYRDLRDVSIARYHRYFNFPQKKDHPNFCAYHKMKRSDAINDSIERVSDVAVKWIEGWIDIKKKNKNMVLLLRFEDLIKNPKREFKKILKFYQINLDEDFIDKICKKTEGKKTMFQNINESRILPGAISSNFRSGKIGNWKKEFSKENMKLAKKLLGKHLIKLKYEDSLNWKI